MFRDRTNLYISYRQSYAHHPKRPLFGSRNDLDAPTASSSALPEERRGLISSEDGLRDNGDAVIEMDQLAPRWVDVQDEVTELLGDIAVQSAQLSKLHQKHVLPGFGDEEARAEEEREIERLMGEISRGFHACQRAIGRIDAMIRENKENGMGVRAGEEAMAKNLKISLASRVQEASAKFRKSQSNYLKKLRNVDGLPSPTLEPRTPAQDNAGNPYMDPSLFDSEVDKSYSQSTISQIQSSQQQLRKPVAGMNEAAIAQREREINDIAQGIIELSDIFQSLQSMVIDQGTMLDRIDFNVERMTTEVKGAEKELKVATNYQRRSTKRKIMLLLAIIVLGLFILLLVKPKGHDKRSARRRELYGTDGGVQLTETALLNFKTRPPSQSQSPLERNLPPKVLDVT